MLKRFTKYVTQSVAGMIGISVYVRACEKISVN